MAQTGIRLIARGDDSGMCHSANLAVLEAFEKGILRNTSMMAPCPAFEEAAEMYRDLDGLCLGLHATLNSEWDTPKWGPVLPPDEVPSLVDERGHLPQTTQQLHERGAAPGEMMAEIRAQLDLARSRGLEIAYVDTHMGFTWVDEMADRVAAFAEREGLIYRHPVDRLPNVEGEFADAVERLIARLDAAGPGTYLFVTHPGYDNEEMRRFGHPGLEPGQVARERDWDRRVFVDTRIVEYCAASGVEPVRWTDVAG
jgi:hypothetical protein